MINNKRAEPEHQSTPCSEHQWWQRGVLYQVYPRSFLDSNGDGIGDLPGVIRKLDYLHWLGVDALWLSPIYPSPMADFGYDVSNYTDIHPLFGTLKDFETLLDMAHRRGLKVILDFVPNHTSDLHPWFLESRSSRDNSKRDWYLWRDPAPGGGPPNNWLSVFGGRAWEWDEGTGQFYYHAFLKQQPDLNWRNPDVQDAMLNVMRFWLDRGVDGFRVDTMSHLIKDDQFRDNPPDPTYRPGRLPHRVLMTTYTTDRPEVHAIIARMRRLTNAYEGRLIVGELYLPVERLMAYYGTDGGGAHLPFNFQLIELPWHARTIAAAIDAYEAALPPDGWPNWVLGNHDKPRIATRVGAAQARVAAMLLLSLRGTPTMYYGDEIGMQDGAISAEHVHDPLEKHIPGAGLGRDPARTPMQWDASSHAGFTRGRPWLPVSMDSAGVNVESQRANDTSLLSLYRRLIGLRCADAALAVGSYQTLYAGAEALAFLRRYGARRLLIALNFTSSPAEVDITALHSAGRVIVSTHLDREGEAVDATLRLRADEGVIVEVSDPDSSARR
ncbi:MAG TPA: alpha-amylase family glycosyl hydrolase [Nitrospiraceae bacterium]|nr:alpha-amylase family glycosyl hydrolase [Nitrospiraceae bacterium]